MMAKLLPSMPSDPDAFYQDLLEKLCVAYTTSGSFKKVVTLRNGTEVTHHLSWAVGMMFSGSESQYRGTNRLDIPVWVSELHPVLQKRLFDSALEHGQVLPAEQSNLAVEAPIVGGSGIPFVSIASWASQYLKAAVRLDRKLSMTLRQLLGDRPLDAVLAVTMDRNKARRNQILTAMTHLYECLWPHEPIAQWAHEQLGGWFYKDISSSLNWPIGLWPFRQPDTELESL
jgi:hypothetical protein